MSVGDVRQAVEHKDPTENKRAPRTQHHHPKTAAKQRNPKPRMQEPGAIVQRYMCTQKSKQDKNKTVLDL